MENQVELFLILEQALQILTVKTIKNFFQLEVLHLLVIWNCQKTLVPRHPVFRGIRADFAIESTTEPISDFRPIIIENFKVLIENEESQKENQIGNLN